MTIKQTPLGFMAQRQAVLKKDYQVNPENAIVTDWAKTDSTDIPADCALRSEVVIDHHNPTRVPIGVHKAVGGDSDAPTPGDLLSGALAACLDTTIRVVANGFGVKLTKLSVTVQAQVDVRGTLGVGEGVPVGFQTFDAQITIDTSPALPAKQLEGLLGAAERSCIVMQTLKPGAQITLLIDSPEPLVA